MKKYIISLVILFGIFAAFIPPPDARAYSNDCWATTAIPTWGDKTSVPCSVDPVTGRIRVDASLGVTATENPPANVEGATVDLSTDLQGNLRTTLGTLLAGERLSSSQETSYLQTRDLAWPSYSVSNTFTPVATPTDIITVTGSATTVVKVWSLKVCTTNTAAGSQEFRLIKRSSADTGGTSVTSTLVPEDSLNPAATAVITHYTANPGALGTAVGTLNIVRWASPVLIPGSFAGVVEDACKEILPRSGELIQPVVLRGITQQLAVNFNGAALVAGQIHAFSVLVTEQTEE